MRWFTDLVWNPKFLCHIQIFQKSSFKPEDQSAQKKCLATYHLNFLKVKNIARHSMASHTETICMLCFKRKWLHAKKKKKGLCLSDILLLRRIAWHHSKTWVTRTTQAQKSQSLFSSLWIKVGYLTPIYFNPMPNIFLSDIYPVYPSIVSPGTEK